MEHTFTTPERTVDLDIDAEGAYAFLTDLNFLPQWYPGLEGVDVPPESEHPGVGDHFIEHRAVLPKVPVAIDLEVTSAEPAHRFSVAAVRPRVGSIEGIFRFSETGPSRTRVTLNHHITVSGRALTPAGMLLKQVISRGDRAQAEAMPEGLARWRAS